MDSQTMLKVAVVLFALTGAGGLLLAGIRFSSKRQPPASLAMLHGMLAGSGMTLVIYAGIAAGMPNGAWAGLILLGIAAVGGVVLNLAYHWRNKELPAPLILIHAPVAVIGLVLLTVSVWK
ncbi:hypothetical protein FN976_26880 [Caenimonas sedimenti]|uniref:DUF423 domain-containing protein n=1 Tax=Caenimonas sedimenti TaxID=2596921 RepID=A0A562ZFG2_9BURK|nr:hypothetical protein [Caenimonas sedimenti]TWO66007.1 hypothetical protein FN976_26880 [Caenimonas sedimenti]